MSFKIADKQGPCCICGESTYLLADRAIYFCNSDQCIKKAQKMAEDLIK